jgi:hypothetical protein
MPSLSTITNALVRIAEAIRSITPQQEDWNAPTLINSWVNFGAGYETAGYRKETGSVVRLQGMVKTGSIGTVIFVLPSGYRPTNELNFLIISNAAVGQLTIFTNGNVKATVGSSSWFSLDGISFSV